MLDPVVAKGREQLVLLKEQLGKVILGKPEVLDRLLVALLSGSHLLVEDVPGVGKTTLAKALARCIDGEFKRAQFTPDLLPTDILGSSVYNPKDGSFTFKKGPIFTNVLLADEINRASPRTQSALLEAMSERQVSIEGVTHALPAPFLVIATQNPIEFHGTYPLPEAQLDRFGMRMSLGHPAQEHEVDVLYSQAHHHPLDDLKPVLDGPAILELQARTRSVRVDRNLGQYLIRLADASRKHPSIKMGCSTRGMLSLFRIIQARAFHDGRDFAIPEDVKAEAVHALAHRLSLDTKAKYSGVKKEDIVRQILEVDPRRHLKPSRAIDARRLPLIGAVVRVYQDRLTVRGRWLLWALVVLGALGLDTTITRVYVLFAIALGALLTATSFAERRRPRLKFIGAPPTRATAGTPVRFNLGLDGDEGRTYRDLSLSLLSAPGLKFSPAEIPLTVEPGKGALASVVLEPARRGRYELRGPRARRVDPLGLVGTRFVSWPDQVLLVYPRFFTMERFDIPLGRRHQPGGIPLSSNTGDSVEFTGTRDYREGDPIRSIHWRSWARRGQPVVKEYQEEYFCQIAIILDTFMPAKTATAAFEASISMVASIADFFSRSEYIVDILAAGPDIYQVSAGRSLAYLENILDVLACLDPCPDPPFQTIGPALFERLAQVTTVVAILQDWDPQRREFLQRVRESGSAVRAIIVHDGPTTEDWRAAGEEIDEISQMSTDDVERALKGGA